MNNYGTNSIMIAIGTMHKAEKIAADGTRQVRDVVELGITLDERVADGFYFGRSLKSCSTDEPPGAAGQTFERGPRP